MEPAGGVAQIAAAHGVQPANDGLDRIRFSSHRHF
jgi:hypothetical protein